jgi:hypothetical protein
MRISLILNSIFLSLILSFPSLAQGLETHGFLSQGYMKSSHHNYLGSSEKGSFDFTEFGLNIMRQVDGSLRMGIQFFARDLGNLGDNRILIDWAYADYNLSENFGVRLGKMYMPLGLYNEGRDVDLLRTSVLLPQSVYYDTFRDVLSFRGAELYGDFSLNQGGTMESQIFSGNIELSHDSALLEDFGNIAAAGALEAARTALTLGGVPTLGLPTSFQVNSFSENSDNFLGWNLIWNTPIEGLRFGHSYAGVDFALTGETQLLPVAPVTGPKVPLSLLMEIKARTHSLEYSLDRWTFIYEREDLRLHLSGTPVFIEGYYPR